MAMTSVWRMVAATTVSVTMMFVPGAALAQQSNTVLKSADTQKLLPPSVYYLGQSATTQLRNSGGVKFADGFYVLATLVDTSGYATGVAAKYQAYFIAEVPIKIRGKDLPAGVYGVGFVADNTFVVTDIGGHDVLTVASSEDAGLKRPTPLQVLADQTDGVFRLYAGRRFVSFTR